MARVRLHRDPRIRALLPAGRAATLLAITTVGASLASLLAAQAATGPWSRLFGLGVAVPPLLVTLGLATRLARKLSGNLGRFWRVITAGFGLALIATGAASIEGWTGRTVTVLVTGVTVPALSALVLWSLWLRPQAIRGQAGTIGFFNVVVIFSVLTGYGVFFLVLPLLDATGLAGLLWVWTAFLGAVFISVGVLLLRRPHRDGEAHAETLFGLMLCLSIAGVLLIALASLGRGVPIVDAVPPPLTGLMWSFAWFAGIAMAYAESSTGLGAPGSRIGDARSGRPFWPYAVLAMMPPLAVGAVVVHDVVQKVAALVGFTFVFLVVLARQLLLIAERRADCGHQQELRRQARVERARTHALLDAALELAGEDERQELCATTATRLRAALDGAYGIVVLAEDPAGRQEPAAAAAGVDLGLGAKEAWSLVGRSPEESTSLPREVVKALTGNDAARRGWTVSARSTSGRRIGVVVLVAPALWTPGADEAALTSGFADQLAVALERVNLLNDLRARGAHVRTLVEHLREGVAVLDGDLRHLACNTAYAECMQSSLDALVGARVRDLFPARDPRRRVFALVTEPQAGEFCVTQSDGTLGTFEHSVTARAGGSAARTRGAAEGVMAVVRDVTASREREARIMGLVEELELREQAGSELLDRVISSAEDERRRLTSELSAGPVEVLSALGMRLDAARTQLGNSQRAAELLREVRRDVAAVIDSLRVLVGELRPPALDERGIGSALQSLCRRIEAETAIAVTISVGDVPRLPGSAETVLYRVGQEALTNAVRHARASRIDVRLRGDSDAVVLDITDDGSGCGTVDAAQIASLTAGGRFGIAAMTERLDIAGGSFSVEAGQAGGTHVRATLPAEWE